MTRSHRHQPYYSHTGARGAMSKWRTLNQRRIRRRNHVRIERGDEPVLMREVSNLWDSPQDGGRSSFDPREDPRWLRK